MLRLLSLTFAVCVLGVNAFFTITAPRNVTSTLAVTNGGQFGDWGPAQFCPSGQFAVGYDMKIESYQYTGDDTALNAIALLCSDEAGLHFAENVITSTQGPYGDWKGRVTCNQRPATPMYLAAFALQVEGPQGSLDDSAANWAKFQCQDMYATTGLEALNIDPGKNSFGDWGQWSRTCDPGSAICGMKTKVEGSQGSGDDTALNDVIFYCCSIRDHGNPVVG